VNRAPKVTTVFALGALLVAAGCGSPQSARQSGAPPRSPSTSTRAHPTTTTASSVPATGASGNWLSYHADQGRSAAVPSDPSLAQVQPAWSANLGGAVYGQPVIAEGRIFAATENNRVVALSPGTGKVLWSTSLGAPLTDVQRVAGCGDIDPLGVTSTPVVDTVSGIVYVVGEVDDGGGVVHHQLEGLSVTSGSVMVSDDVDPPLPSTERPVSLLQRASLALGNGRVYVGYGGNFGDCGTYHGWVVGVDESGPSHRVSFEVASDGQGGAIWQSGGAPALDAAGDLYVTTGNANPDPPEGGPDPKHYTESVVKLSPTLVPMASFKDTVAGGDEDLSTGNPVLLPNGDLFAVGKTDIGYVLRQTDLSQVAAVKGVCGSDPDGGPAYDVVTNRVFVPCRGGGIQVINLATTSLGSRLSGSNGAPILVGRDLWSDQYPAGTLTDYNATTGARVQTVPVGQTVPTFTSPSAGLGLLLVGTTSGVTAFKGSSAS
jgi:polyvinyl alcohol dehydrogenase (cytochrome)